MQKFQLQDKQAISAIVCIQTPTYIVNIDKSLLAIGGWLGLFRNNILTRLLVSNWICLVRDQRDPWYHNSPLSPGSILLGTKICTILSEVVRCLYSILCITYCNAFVLSLVLSLVELSKIVDFLAFWEKLFIKTRRIWVGIQREMFWGLELLY